MKDITKIVVAILIAGCLVGIIGGFIVAVVGGNSQSQFGTNSPNRYPNGYLDTGGGYYVDGVSVIDGDGNFIIASGGYLQNNQLQTKVSYGNFTDATTTYLALVNPLSATSTIDLSIIDVSTSATATAVHYCGTSTNAYPSGMNSYNIVNAQSVATDTKAYFVLGQGGSGVEKGSGVTYPKLVVGPAEYVVCKVTSTYPGAFTEVTNTFDGTYKIRWNK